MCRKDMVDQPHKYGIERQIAHLHAGIDGEEIRQFRPGKEAEHHDLVIPETLHGDEGEHSGQKDQKQNTFDIVFPEPFFPHMVYFSGYENK